MELIEKRPTFAFGFRKKTVQKQYKQTKDKSKQTLRNKNYMTYLQTKNNKLMKKTLSLLTMLLLSICTAWAETETSPTGGTKDTQVNGTSFYINSSTNAGDGTQISPMTGKGIKVRVNSPLVMTVNEGYIINSVTAYAAANDNSKTFQIKKIEVDGIEYVPSGVTMPITCAQKNATTATSIEITGIAATKNITFTFDGTGTQGIMEFHVNYSVEQDKTFYLKPGAWDASDATERYAVNVFSTNEDATWIDFKAVEGDDGIYSVVVPKEYSKFIL